MESFKPQNSGKGLPCCPNHGEPLEGIGFPIPSKGTGICPVSGAPFDFEIELDQEEVTRDKFGNERKEKKFNVTGEEKQDNSNMSTDQYGLANVSAKQRQDMLRRMMGMPPF